MSDGDIVSWAPKDLSFKIFANQPVILSHLCEKPLLPLGWDVTLPSKTHFTHQEILFIYKSWPTSLPINKVTPSYSTSHIPPIQNFLCILFVLALFVVFIYHFSCIQLLSSPRAARMLINWLTGHLLTDFHVVFSALVEKVIPPKLDSVFFR